MDAHTTIFLIGFLVGMALDILVAQTVLVVSEFMGRRNKR